MVAAMTSDERLERGGGPSRAQVVQRYSGRRARSSRLRPQLTRRLFVTASRAGGGR